MQFRKLYWPTNWYIKKGYKIIFHLITGNLIKANPEKRVVYVTAAQLI